MKTLGIVLARGGSQGLPGKHLLPLAGKAVVRHTIELAGRTDALDRAVLSTDDERIGAEARGTRVEFLPRPAELATSTAPVQGAMRHAVRAIHGRDDWRPDRVALLYGNVPVRPRGIVERGLALAEKTGADTILSLSEVGKMHPLWMHMLDGDRIRPYQEGVGAAGTCRATGNEG
ncbi:MAG: NTP transferase domain-containing protein, partial [Planctomycetes bacterium]|nr:NTP transferase domain-containing protein [Planctomycetota bacterium]